MATVLPAGNVTGELGERRNVTFHLVAVQPVKVGKKPEVTDSH